MRLQRCILKHPSFLTVVFCRVSFRLPLLTLGGRNRLWKGHHGCRDYISRQTRTHTIQTPRVLCVMNIQEQEGNKWKTLVDPLNC